LILQPVSQAGGLDLVRIDVPLIGVKDGTQDTFTTPSKFYQTANLKITVIWNGRRLRAGVDFNALESGGAGTGYDTVKLLWSAAELLPRASDELVADYYADPS
jgi:hypothetical protein